MSSEATILHAALDAFYASVEQRDDTAVQLAVPFGRQAGSAVDAAVDHVRKRFGSAAITRAVLLGRDRGVSVPLLPD